MDATDFDALIQSFGMGTRRDGLRLLLGAALGGILAGLPAADAAAKRSRHKRKKNKKQKKDRCIPFRNCDYICRVCSRDKCVNLPDLMKCSAPTHSDYWHCVGGVCTDCGYRDTPCCGDANWCEFWYCCNDGVCGDCPIS
jgi:hypothetical protein